MNTFRTPLLFFFFGLLAFVSCKDKNDPDPTVTKEDILVSTEWKGQQALIMGIDVELAKQLIPNLPSEVFEKLPNIQDMRIAFKRDGTFTATYVAGSNMQPVNGTWELTESSSKLRADALGEMDITKLEANTLELRTNIEYERNSYPVDLKFIPR